MNHFKNDPTCIYNNNLKPFLPKNASRDSYREKTYMDLEKPPKKQTPGRKKY